VGEAKALARQELSICNGTAATGLLAESRPAKNKAKHEEPVKTNITTPPKMINTIQTKS
jgi:hypothetical protein